MNELLEKILTGALTIVLFGWVWVRSQARSDKFEERLALIEKTGLTREEFVREMAGWSQKREQMHEENQSALREIRQEMKDNEKRRSSTEHAILDVVNALNLKQAASEAVENYRNRRDER
jgi:hypothetical protein